MAKINPKMVEVIQDNAGLADESISVYVKKCCEDYPPGGLTMAVPLAIVLSDAFDGWKNVIGAVVNDEGFQKWKRFTDYESLCAEKASDYWWYKTKDLPIEILLAGLWSYAATKGAKELLNHGIDIKHTPTGIDYSIAKGLGFKPGKTFGPCLNPPLYTYQLSDPNITSKLISKANEPLYVGVLVPKSDFPDAYDCKSHAYSAFEPQRVETYGKKYGWENLTSNRNLITNPLAPDEIFYEQGGQYCHPIVPEYVKSACDNQNLGLIYVSADKFMKLNNVRDDRAGWLPWEVVNKKIATMRGVPIVEI